MCGFAGIVHHAASIHDVNVDVLRRMTRRLAHRGPDGEGFFLSPKAALGHRRLAVIDPAGGGQPMTSEDGVFQLVYNGEIYNFQEIEEGLRARGRRFRTRCDTEVILQAYQAYGTRCVEYFRGMFAFALWDARRRRLFMARDRLGKKPLCYAVVGDGLIFASEISALLEHPAVSREIDPQALDLYLTCQYVPSPWTIYKNVRKLPPAHIAVWHDGRMAIERYWSPAYEPKWTGSFEEASRALLEKLRESVRLRLISDVPLGAFLSGGIDSATIVGLMSQLSRRPVKTFSIGFEDSGYSELREARALARHFSCDHHEWIVRPDAAETLPRLARHYGEPFADPSALPTYYVARETRREVTVALSGDGGDESLAGYYRYPAMMFLQRWDRLPAKLRRLLGRWGHALPAAQGRRGLSGIVREMLDAGAAGSLEEQYRCFLEISRRESRLQLYNADMKNALAKAGAVAYLGQALTSWLAKTGESLDAYLATDLTTYLPGCLMVKTDIASMAHALEVRCPFLDHEVLGFIACLPAAWKWRPLLHTKWILRQALRGTLPESALRQKKRGFELPTADWLRGPLRAFLESALLGGFGVRSYFNRSAVEGLIQSHARGAANHGALLWALLMFELWHQTSREPAESL